MLPINHSPSLFYKINLQKLNSLDEETKELISHINLTWSDIEYLNYLFHKSFGMLTDENETSMLFSSLIVMSNSFYVYLSIIYSLIKKMGEKNLEAKHIISSNSKFFKRIQILRNTVLIHKEQPNFKKPMFSMSSTDPKNLIEYQIFTINEITKKEEKHELKPLEDIALMHKILNDLEIKLLSLNGQYILSK